MAPRAVVAITIWFVAVAAVVTSHGANAMLGGTTTVGSNSFTTAASFVTCPSTAPSGMTWLNGFETGRIFAGNGGNTFYAGSSGATNVTADATVARNGAYSMKVAPVGTATNAQWIATVSATTMVLRFGVRLASLPLTDVELTRYGPSSGAVLQLMYHTSTQKLALQFSTGTSVESSSTIAASTWYVIDLKLDMSTTTWSGNWAVNKVAQTARTASAASAGTVYSLWMGTTLSANTFTANYDDLAVSIAGADYPLGDGKVLTLRPDGVGTNNLATNFQNDDGTAISSSSYTRMAETPMSSSTQYIKQVTIATTAYIEFAFAATTETCIRAVQGVEMYNDQGTTTTNNGKASVFDGSTERVIYSGSMTSSSASYGGEFVQAKVAPPTGAAWTPAELNALVIRVGYSSDVTPIVRFDALAIDYEVPL